MGDYVIICPQSPRKNPNQQETRHQVSQLLTNPLLIYCQALFYLTNKNKIMSSQGIHSALSNSFAQSTVSSSAFNGTSFMERKVMTPVVGKRQFDYSKSYVYENPRTKKDGIGLRRTINYDQPLTSTPNRIKLQGFLRNTSYFSIEEDKQIGASKRLDKSQYAKLRLGKDSWSTTGNSCEEGKSTNVQKILEKIQKKEKLINELKELSKFNVTQQMKSNIGDSANASNEKVGQNRSVRNSIQFKPENYQLKKNPLQKEVSMSIDKPFAHVIMPKNEKCEPISVNNISDKVDYKISDRLGSNNLAVKNKNPEQQLGKEVDFKKAKNSYLTPKETSSTNQDRVSSVLLLSKKESVPDKQPKSGQLLYRSCKYNTDTIPEPKSATYRRQQPKSIQDIRQLSDIRIIKNNLNYFTNKWISIYDFELLKPLGQGKFGSVIQAVHKATNSIYAIKKISKRVIQNNLMIDQLVKQIKIQSFCQHENILQLYGVFDDSDYVYLILEYMQEGTLFSQLKKRKVFTENQAAIQLKQAAKAIIYLHDNGIAHRDIKPENIVMSNGVGKLCDFGWATYCGNDRRKTYCGTFDYAAPEILEGSEYDITVDLWCLGVLAYELVVGKAPFFHYSRKQTMKRILNVENESISYPSGLSKETISFIDSLVRKKPEQRLNGNNILAHPFMLMTQSGQ